MEAMTLVVGTGVSTGEVTRIGAIDCSEHSSTTPATPLFFMNSKDLLQNLKFKMEKPAKK
jgi:hypothetical protein